jgi:hypothetical protein
LEGLADDDLAPRPTHKKPS